MDAKDIRQEVLLGLPSFAINHVTRALAVVNPDNGKLLILKSREDRELKIDDFEYYADRHDWTHKYDELHGKYILLDPDLLNRRGRAALAKLV